MTKKIIWRLKEQPSAENLRDLVKEGLLNKDEAREILFSHEEQEVKVAPKTKELESEIKFLRELVEKLSHNSSYRIFEVIKEIAAPYRIYPWYQPYYAWCGTMSTNTAQYTTTAGGNTTLTSNLNMVHLQANAPNSAQSAFSSIKTF